MKLTFTLIALFSFSLLHAQKAGTLDSSFGNQGKIVYTLPDNYAECYASALQTDGKIIVAGEAGYGEPTGSFFLRRYNTDGTVDISFGDSGNVISYFGFTEQGIYALAITSDNKIVAAGFCNDLGLNICMARYLPDGRLDNTFGKNGVVNSDLGGWEWARGMVLQPDGKILITGRVTPSPIGNFMVARYSENGNLDSSFGSNGRTITDLGGDDQSGCIALQKDGKIVIGGYQAPIDNSGRNELFALARYTTDGVLDESFGNKGIVLQDFTDYYDIVNALAIQGDGKIIAAGQVNGSYDYQHEYMAAARFNTDGSLDAGFGDNGLAEAKFPRFATIGNAVGIQEDGKILLGGSTYQPSADTSDFALARFLQDGTPDNSFGTNGQVTTDFGLQDDGLCLLLQPDGNIVMAGEDFTNYPPVVYSVAIARYNNDDLTKKQIIVQKIRHYIQTHNAQATILNAVSIYPNPAQNVLHVVGLSSAQTKLTVVDLNGRIAASCKLQAVSGVCDLKIASLHAGNYLLKIEMNDQVVTKQFIKQ
jgi:uncharacterized delta-60 repeat protein